MAPGFLPYGKYPPELGMAVAQVDAFCHVETWVRRSRGKGPEGDRKTLRAPAPSTIVAKAGPRALPTRGEGGGANSPNYPLLLFHLLKRLLAPPQRHF